MNVRWIWAKTVNTIVLLMARYMKTVAVRSIPTTGFGIPIVLPIRFVSWSIKNVRPILSTLISWWPSKWGRTGCRHSLKWPATPAVWTPTMPLPLLSMLGGKVFAVSILKKHMKQPVRVSKRKRWSPGRRLLPDGWMNFIRNMAIFQLWNRVKKKRWLMSLRGKSANRLPLP